MPSVTTKNPKWAFENKSDAQAFISRNSGKPATFEEKYPDTQMIRERRKILMRNANEQKMP